MDVNELGFEPNAERIKWLRKLAKGRGIEYGEQLPDGFPLELFGAKDQRYVAFSIVFWSLRLPRWRAVSAIYNAFGYEKLADVPLIGDDDEAQYRASLMYRREKFAVVHGVSMRTVMRLEEMGATIMDDFIQRDLSDDRLTASSINLFQATRYAIKSEPAQVLEWARLLVTHLESGGDENGVPKFDASPISSDV